MKTIEKALTWIDILLNPTLNGGARPFRQGKHSNGSKPSPNAHLLRLVRNKRQRQARKAGRRR